MDDFLRRFRSTEGTEYQEELFPLQPKRPNWFWKHLPTFVILVVLLLLASIAHSEEQTFRAQGVFCDTKEDVTAFVTDWDGKNAKEVVDGINILAGKASCILSQVTLSEVERPAVTMTSAMGEWQLVEIKIHMLHHSGLTIYLPEPQTAFTYIQVQKVGQAI
jgi:hypothetical protein